MKRSDGSTFDAEVIARPIEIQDKPGVQVWMKDITERKETEDALCSLRREVSSVGRQGSYRHRFRGHGGKSP